MKLYRLSVYKRCIFRGFTLVIVSLGLARSSYVVAGLRWMRLLCAGAGGGRRSSRRFSFILLRSCLGFTFSRILAKLGLSGPARGTIICSNRPRQTPVTSFPSQTNPLGQPSPSATAHA